MTGFRRFTAVLTGSLLLTAQGFADDGVRVSVSEFLEKDLLRGSGYQLQPEASISGARALFTLNSDQGQTTVTGAVSLLERINEIQAVAVLEEMKKSDVYIDAVKNSGKAPVEFGKSLVEAPVDTVSDAAKGLGGFLADVGYSVVSDDPSQENVAKTGLGFATAKRNFAYQLGVNSYSHYQPLQDALGEVSWTAAGGGLTVTAAFRAVSNTAGSVLSATKTANMGRVLVRDNSPRKLQNRNFDSLQAMGVSEDLADTLLDNYNFDPEAETRLVTALEGMDKVAGRADIVARASLADSRNAAEEMRDWVELLAAYHELVTPAGKLVIISSAAFIVDKKNRVHGVFPTDYIVWTPDQQAVIKATTDQVKAAGYRLGPIYATGKVDPKVAKLLEDNGWSKVQDRAERILRTE